MIGAVVWLAAGPAVFAQPASVPVTVDNFKRAESDMYLGNFAKEADGLAKLRHNREPASIDNQTVIRLNRDTLYSSAIFDLDAGPAMVTMPEAGKRFMSLMILNEDHYVTAVHYGPGTRKLTRQNVGTRYVLAGIRTLVDPADSKDVAQVHALQDAIKISQPGGPGKFEAPNWDSKSQKEIRDALLKLNDHMGGFSHAFGRKGEVDPIKHLIATAAGWGGNPDKDASYLSVTPSRNDGKTVFKMKVPANVPVEGFWSISLYNAKGYFEKTAYNAYSVNNITAKKDGDGGVTIQFGGCDGKTPNCVPIMEGWNYTVRMYRPRV